MLLPRSFAGAVSRTLLHSQVSVCLSLYLYLLTFCRLFEVTRPLHPLLLLLVKKQVTYVFARPHILQGAHFRHTLSCQGKYTVTLIPGDGKAYPFTRSTAAIK
jgi:hypothetical protein